jgi:hypothetical protein
MADEQQLSSDQFAAQIKAKYPQYKDVPNAELTQKIVAKYPQYKDKVKMEAHMPGNTGGSSGTWDEEPTGLKGVAAGFEKTIAQGVATATEGIGNTIQRMRGKPTLSVDKKELEPANASQAVGAAAESVAEYAVGEAGLKALNAALKLKNVAAVSAIVAKFPKLAEIAEAGLKAAGIGTALSAAHGEAHPVEAGAVTGMFGAGGEAASQVLKSVAPSVIAKSNALMNRYIGLQKSDLPKWERFKPGSADDIGKTVIERVGVKRTLAEQHAAIESVRDNVNAETEHMLSQVKGKLVPFHANLQSISDKLAKELFLAGQDKTGAAVAALNANIQEFKEIYNPNLTVQEALKLRRIVGQQVKWSQLSSTENVRQMVLGEMYHTLNDSIENALPTGMARKFAANNKLQQRLIIARDAAGEKLNNEAKAKGPGLVSKTAGMATGATVGAVVGGAAGERYGHPGEGAAFGAVAGAGIGHGKVNFDMPRADIATSRSLAKAAPRLAQLAKKSPVAARALQAITDAHGGGSGALAAQQ